MKYQDHNRADLSPLRDNDWEFILPDSSMIGYWVDPVTNMLCSTGKALRLQEERKKEKKHG